MKAVSKTDQSQQSSEHDPPPNSALAVSCFAMGMILAGFVLANDLLKQMTFSMGVAMLAAMAALPLMVWLSFGRQNALENSVLTKKAHWQVRLVAMLWVFYSFMLLLAVQRAFLSG